MKPQYTKVSTKWDCTSQYTKISTTHNSQKLKASIKWDQNTQYTMVNTKRDHNRQKLYKMRPQYTKHKSLYKN